MGGNSLSKAKRGKRRWLGLQFSSEIAGRDEFKAVMKSLSSLPDTWRLYDLKVGSETTTGLAIIRVPLEDYPAFREVLSGDDGSGHKPSNGENEVEPKVISRTSSGKIKLIRERLGLERPKRVRKTK